MCKLNLVWSFLLSSSIHCHTCSCLSHQFSLPNVLQRLRNSITRVRTNTMVLVSSNMCVHNRLFHHTTTATSHITYTYVQCVLREKEYQFLFWIKIQPQSSGVMTIPHSFTCCTPQYICTSTVNHTCTCTRKQYM